MFLVLYLQFAETFTFSLHYLARFYPVISVWRTLKNFREAQAGWLELEKYQLIWFGLVQSV